MSFEQGAIMAILLAMLIAYATDRFRIELVAMCGLAAGFLVGVVPIRSVFAGFSSPAVMTVVEILLVVATLSRTRVVDDFAGRLLARVHSETALLLFLCPAGAAVSIFMNNVGALALMFPVAMSSCARLGIAPAKVLMALSFATLLGGMCSLTGTPANLVVNEWMVSETGRGFGYFELGIVGGPLAIAGVLWVANAAPRLFSRFSSQGTSAFDAGPVEFLAERVLASESRFAGLHLLEFEEQTRLQVHGVVRNGAHVFARRSDIVLAAGDTLLLRGNISRIEEIEEANELRPAHRSRTGPEAMTIEVVVMHDSLFLGSRIEDVEAFGMQSIAVSALASRRGRIEGSFAGLQIGVGDVMILSGDRDVLRQLAVDGSLLVLSPRRPARPSKHAGTSVGIFAAGVLATALDLVPTEIAFGAVVLALVMTGNLKLRAALQDLNWGVVILLACMIPLGVAVQDTGAARLIAGQMAAHLPTGQPLIVIGAILLLAVAITPFIDNVSTAIVLSPIAAGLATRTGTPVEPLLMAVAVGASLDFLTPFGHHNNAIIMGAGGYRFIDFPRLGAPLTIICLALAALVFGLMLAV